MINFLLICLIVLVALLAVSLICIVILSKKNVRLGFDPVILPIIILFLLSAVLITIGIMLISNPQSVYVHIHWIGILFGGLGAAILLIAAGVILYKNDTTTIAGVIHVISGIAVFVFMVLGIKLAPNTTYEITVAEDINLLRNLPSPSGKTYLFSVTDDIDFYGFEFKESYGIPDTYVIIEGNGYTWSNINYEVTSDHYSVIFLDLCTYASNTRYSAIQNLTITNSCFCITPNNYDKDSHEGRGVDFALIPEYIELNNVTIDAIIYCGDPVENIRSDSPSYIDKIYPKSRYDKDENIDINIRIVKF